MSRHDPTWIDPEEHALAERGAALIAAAVAETRAPQRLRERIEADRARPPERRPWAARRGSLLGGLAAAVAAAAVAVVLATGGSTGEGGPSVLAVAALGVRAPAQPAPADAPGSRTLLRRSVEGVSFPDWSYRFDWRPSGARSDRVGGRAMTTVFYDGPRGTRLAYTIVAGDALGRIDHAQTTTVAGTRLWTVRRGGRTIVTWERAGHTCVISAPASVPASRLHALAAWRDAGSVLF
ncbi:MAG TPA: hypothetical protein VFT42_00480 [Solirubrobacteraceae bacterium]|nr:hypothetical protein [Solirubrobacteraceae bacterium]